MEEGILNFLPTAMFRGTDCIYSPFGNIFNWVQKRNQTFSVILNT